MEDETRTIAGDIWSLGITAIELATGATPLEDTHPMQAMFMIVENPAPRLEGSFSGELKHFVKMCLQKEPSKCPSAQELLKHKFLKLADNSDGHLDLSESHDFDARAGYIDHILLRADLVTA